jgi:hypothetical protein
MALTFAAKAEGESVDRVIDAIVERAVEPAARAA